VATVLAEIFRSAYGQFGFVLFCVILIFALFDSQFSVYDRHRPDVRGHGDGRNACHRPAPIPLLLLLDAGDPVRRGDDNRLDADPVHPVGHHQLGRCGGPRLAHPGDHLPEREAPSRPDQAAAWIVVANVAWAIILFVYFIGWTIYDNPLGLKL